MPSDLDVLTDNRSDPGARSVLEDMERSRYRVSPVSRLGFALSFIHDAADADAAHAHADAAHAHADAAHAHADAAHADADAAHAHADAAHADADAARIDRLTKLLSEETDMRNGLKIVQLTGAYYGWAVTRIGWLRRVSGDGPMKDHRLTDIEDGAEDVNRILIRRSFAANEETWLKHCPRPSGWQDE